jgi:hypothetical protein
MNTPQDALLNVSARLCQRDDWKDPLVRGDIKRVVAIMWKQMTASERRAFIGRLDGENKLTAPMKRVPNEELELLTIIQGWQKVIANVSSEDRNFALSIMKHRGKEGWWPSDKQAAKMKALWVERSIDGGEIEVCE